MPTHPPGIGDGSSCRVGWDMRINIHLPMHMDNAHSCPAFFAFIRTNCFRSAGRRVGGGDVPIHRLGIGGLPTAVQTPPSCWISIPAPECPCLPLFLPPNWLLWQIWGSQGGKGAWGVG